MPPMATVTSVMSPAFCQVFMETPVFIMWLRTGLGEFGAVAAIEEVDEKADDQPDDEAVPGNDGQSGHEQETEDDAESGNDGPEGNNETASASRIAITQDDDADGDEDEGEEGADVG